MRVRLLAKVFVRAHVIGLVFFGCLSVRFDRGSVHGSCHLGLVVWEIHVYRTVLLLDDELADVILCPGFIHESLFVRVITQTARVELHTYVLIFIGVDGLSLVWPANLGVVWFQGRLWGVASPGS